MGKFKVGDRVRFTEKTPSVFWFGPHTEFRAGNITDFTQGLLGVSVDVYGRTAFCDEEYLELIEPDAATAENWDFDPRRELKVGDRVRVTHTDYDSPSLAVGVTGKVARNYGYCFGVVLDVPEPSLPDEDWAFRSDELELLPPAAVATEPEPDISVRVVADMSHLDGEIDRILRRLKKVEKKARKLGIQLEFRDAA